MKTIKNKSSGFTLVEVLAAVTILGILSVVAVVSINGIIQRAKEEHYITAEDQLKLAGESYVQQNRSALPKAIGQKTKVPLKTLVEKNYIKQIKDYSDNNCDINKSYVQIFKYSQSDYSYVAYLDCPAYDSKATIEKGSPKIKITMSEPTTTNSSSASISITDSEKLLSWSYIIYKDGKEVKNSGSIFLKNYPKSLSEKISLAKYTPGKVKVVVTATNIYGLTTTKSSGVINYKDTQGPTCIIKEQDKKTNPKPWTKGPVTITVGCSDGDGVGCTKENYTKTFKTTTDVGKVIIEDKEGNKTTCEVSVNVDVTPPAVPVIKTYKWKNNSTRPTTETGLSAYTANTWSGQNIFTKATGGKDSNSGFAKFQYTIGGAEKNVKDIDGTSVSIETTGTSTIKYRACDKLGNCSAYSNAITIKVDKKAPSCTSSGGSTTWTNSNKTLTGTCSDEHSGCTGNATKTFTSDINSSTESPGTVKDKVGNETVCPSNQTVKIDKIAPTCTSSGGNTSWTNGNRTLTGTCSDTGGSGCKENATKTYASDINSTSESPGNVYDNAGNSATCPGNQTVKIDKTLPSISVKFTREDNGAVYTSGSLSDVTIVRNITYSDKLSGISTVQYNSGSGWSTESNMKNYKYTSDSVNQKIKFRVIDNAGNISETAQFNIRIEKDVDKNYKISCQRTCTGACGLSKPSGGTYWNDSIFHWDLSGAKSGINRSTMGIDYSTDWVKNYCLYNPSNAPDGSRSGCGYAIFNSASIDYSRSYACSSIVGRACTNKNKCGSCTISDRIGC